MQQNSSIKTIIRWILIAIILFILAGGIFYKFFLTDFIANTLLNDSLPSYLPWHLKSKIEKVQKPVSESAFAVISVMHQSGITLDQILKAIDDAKEEQAYAMLDELNTTKITDVDQFFDIGKKYFPVDFDVEVFREVYREKTTMRLIKKAIRHANIYKKEERMDAETAKEIAKKILISKEEEYNEIMDNL